MSKVTREFRTTIENYQGVLYYNMLNNEDLPAGQEKDRRLFTPMSIWQKVSQTILKNTNSSYTKTLVQELNKGFFSYLKKLLIKDGGDHYYNMDNGASTMQEVPFQ